MSTGPIGACAFCGHPDARHRVIDAIQERLMAGDDRAETLEDFGYTEEKYEQVKSEVNG